MYCQNQPQNEATLINPYESIPVTHHLERRAELDETDDEELEPLLQSSSPPLPVRQEGNRVESGSSTSSPRCQDTTETDLPSPSASSDDRALGVFDPTRMYAQVQRTGTSDMQPQTNEEESPPPVPARTEESEVLVEELTDRSPGPQDVTSADVQPPTDPIYDEPQLPAPALPQTSSNDTPSDVDCDQSLQAPPPVPLRTEDSKVLVNVPSPSAQDTASAHTQSPSEPTYDEPKLPPTSSSEDQLLQSPPPVPPRTEESEVLMEESEYSRTCHPHTTVSMDLPLPHDPMYDELQLPVSTPKQQPQSEGKEVSTSEGSGGPTYAQTVLPPSSSVSIPPVAEPVVYEDVKGFNNSKVCRRTSIC